VEFATSSFFFVQNADDLLGEHGLMKDLKIRLMERMLGAELTAHLG
jgi:hypothetical protein